MARQGARIGSGRRSKYGAIRTEVDGMTFASKAEARRWSELKILRASGLIFGDLELQPELPICVVRPDGEIVKVAVYRGDFRYEAPDGTDVVEDVKGFKTPVYRLKKKLVEAQYGIVIREVK
jgi:hypothetical protein